MQNPLERSPKYRVLIMENVNLSFLNESMPVPGPQYQEARVEFIGGQGYTLNEFSANVRLVCMSGGFRIEFREPLNVPAEALLGRSVKTGYLTDVIIHSGGHSLSLGTLYPGWYPKTIREGEVLGVLR